MKKIIALIILVLSAVTHIFGMSGAEKKAVADKIAAGALVVDVRTPAEFNAGHHPGARNIPLDQIKARIKEFGSKTGPIVVYCRTGNRSGIALKILKEQGFTDVTNGGGLTDMKDMPAAKK